MRAIGKRLLKRTQKDNCKFHRYGPGETLDELCRMYGVKLVYLPPYSPELNPIESAFNVFKFHLRKSTCEDLVLAMVLAWSRVDMRCARGFYHGCGYL